MPLPFSYGIQRHIEMRINTWVEMGGPVGQFKMTVRSHRRKNQVKCSEASSRGLCVVSSAEDNAAQSIVLDLIPPQHFVTPGSCDILGVQKISQYVGNNFFSSGTWVTIKN